jgi:CBS domain-containing protein
MVSTFSENRTLPIESLSFRNWWHLLARHTSVVDQNENIHTALKIMVHRGFRHLPVVKRDGIGGNEILGIISAGDLIDYIDSGRLVSGLNNPVSSIMNENPVTICPDDTILDAIRTISEKNIGAILIREENQAREGKFVSGSNKLQGIVTLRDIVSIMAAYVPMGLAVEDYMTRDLATINKLDSISSAVSLMSQKKVRRLPVVSGVANLRVDGMVTNKMILRYLESIIACNIQDVNAAVAMPVLSAMVANMPSIDPKEDCGNVLYLMRELGTGGFAVVDSRGLLGIITERDLVKRIYDAKGLAYFSEMFLGDRMKSRRNGQS